MRALVVTFAVLSLAAPAAAEPVPKSRRCHLVEDPAGDVAVARLAPSPVPRDHVDLLYADVLVSRTYMAVTFGLAGPPTASSAYWALRFTSGRETVWVQAGHPTLSGAWYGGGTNRSYTAGTGRLDTVRNEIRVTVPARAFGAALPRKGVVVSDVRVVAAEAFGDPLVPVVLTGTEPFSDQATARRSSYVWGRTPLC